MKTGRTFPRSVKNPPFALISRTDVVAGGGAVGVKYTVKTSPSVIVVTDGVGVGVQEVSNVVLVLGELAEAVEALVESGVV